MMAQEGPFSVSELTYYIKRRLESDALLRNVEVSGEISNLTHHRSGHVYFSLKDQEAQVSCAMWRSSAQRFVGKLPKHGEKVVALGQISVYPPRGSYQLVVTDIRKAGIGDLHQRFLELKEKLEEEGLFSPEYKKPIPHFPSRVGVVTSATGAVIRDILDTIRRRYPHVEVLLVPTAVQGAAAAPEIVRNLQRLDASGVDTIILGRGGGSLEDLWCFNEEAVVRAIFACKTPVITAIGHETDTTISDFVADLRAATPTAAAERAVPLASEIFNYLDDSERRFSLQLQQFIDYRRQLLDGFEDGFQRALLGYIGQYRLRLEDVEGRLEAGMERTFSLKRHELDKLELAFRSLDMRGVLSRGYSITLKNGKIVRDGDVLEVGDVIDTVLEKGRVQSRVEGKQDDGAA